jgi:hypothetical protein
MCSLARLSPGVPNVEDARIRLPTLPGEILLELYLAPHDVSIAKFADAVGVTRKHIECYRARARICHRGNRNEDRGGARHHGPKLVELAECGGPLRCREAINSERVTPTTHAGARLIGRTRIKASPGIETQ